MWDYMATGYERVEAWRISNASSRELLTTDDRRIPNVVKTAGILAPPIATSAAAAGEMEEEEEEQRPQDEAGSEEDRGLRMEWILHRRQPLRLSHTISRIHQTPSVKTTTCRSEMLLDLSHTMNQSTRS
jgi:hypothetical protein